MKTNHKIFYSDSSHMGDIADESVNLLVTSPPYPMIEMWDELFLDRNPEIKNALSENDPRHAFELMHRELDKTWDEAYRVLSPGAIMCINIGDATRTINGNFQLFSSHSRILNYCLGSGFQNLPNIIWRKTTNAPNKFMGSGMLPPGAYVTLEHEYILIFRKGPKRIFKKNSDKINRRKSAYFWEERNRWFSDVWMGLVGVGQDLNNKDLRKRSAAFPFELAYRLINMFSVKGDIVLDPFLGTGTTTFAAMASERNSIGYEIESNFDGAISSGAENIISQANEYIHNRLEAHETFLHERAAAKKQVKNQNINHGFSCISGQEKELMIQYLDTISREPDGPFVVDYKPGP